MKAIIRGLISALRRISSWADDEQAKTIYPAEEHARTEAQGQIHSIWDYLVFNENTQAFHLHKVVGFEEWIDMQEIMRRIKELFSVDYKNERSLYPYIKTLVDTSLFEANNIGGRRKWRKKDLIVHLGARETIEGEKTGTEATQSGEKAKTKRTQTT